MLIVLIRHRQNLISQMKFSNMCCELWYLSSTHRYSLKWEYQKYHFEESMEQDLYWSQQAHYYDKFQVLYINLPAVYWIPVELHEQENSNQLENLIAVQQSLED